MASNSYANEIPDALPEGDEELLRLWAALQTERGGIDLRDFIPIVTPSFSTPKHLEPFVCVLERACFPRTEADKSGVLACTSVPPQHGKSQTIFHALALVLKKNPSNYPIAYVTYNQEQANTASRQMREIFKRAGLPMRSDLDKLSEIGIEGGSSVVITSIGGTLTGRGFKLIIVDDPFKDRASAESPTIRENVWQFCRGTLFTRRWPGGSIIVNSTRWHPDDLQGRIAREWSNWEVVNLPAIGPKGALWPEQRPLTFLEEQRRYLGEYDFSAQYMGSPTPKGKALFQVATRYTAADEDLVRDPIALRTRYRIRIACDPAVTASTNADYSAVAVIATEGMGPAANGLLLYVWRGQVETPTLLSKLQEVYARWRVPILLESVAGFKAVPQMIRSIDPTLPIMPVSPVGDKLTRALPVIAAWNSGRLRIPQHAPWLIDLLEEVECFSGVNDKHDDQVDALAHCWNALQQGSAHRGVRGVKQVYKP